MLSHRIEREMEHSAKTTLPLNSFGIIHSLPVFCITLHLWYNLHSYYLPKGEKVVHERAYISLKHPFLAIHAKGGEY